MERWQNIGSEHPKDVGPVKIYPLRLGMSLNRQPPKKITEHFLNHLEDDSFW